MASARQIRDEIMKMTIVVNSDPAQKEIYNLNIKTKELSETNKGLSETLREVERARKKEETAINSYADKIDRLKLKLKENQSVAIEQIKILLREQSAYANTSKEFQSYQTKIDLARGKSRANTESLQASITSLVQKQSVLNISYEKNVAESKKLTNEVNANKSSINEFKNKVTELTGSLDVNRMTMGQLKKEAVLLKQQLLHVVDPKASGAIALNDQLGKVNNRMAEIQQGANQTRSSFRGLADTFNHYQGIVVAGMAIFAGFALSVQQVIDRNNKLVDAQTAVAKTVNMTKQEVDELTKSFSTFDTRTSRIDLLKIAETGGRLGIGKEQIKEFVREVDKANVALGDGFAGGVEAVTDTLGKLKNLYGETKDLEMATAINQIGSAMNELGANGAATEQNIGEFALRLGSLPAKLKPTIAESLALGAAFEESGINAERAGTAYSTFVRNAATNSEKFAKVMRLSKKEVEDLMNTDPLEFFLKFSEGMKGMDTTDLAKTMDYLKMNDQYVIATMGAASENTDRFRASIELSNKSLTEATSLTDEFNKVNNNTSAIFDKVQKKFLGMFTSEAVANTLNYLISAFGKFIGAIEDSEGTVTGFRNGLVFLIKIITLMMVTMISYNLVTGVYNALMVTAYQRVVGLTVVEKARNAVMLISNGLATLYRATLWLLAAAYSLLTGNVAGATFAMRGFTAALMANPLGALIGLITLAASAYLMFSNNADEAAKKQKSLNEVMKEGTANAAQEITQLEVLYKTATNVKLSTEERMKAVQKLKAEFPGYFGQISAEIIMNGKAAKSYHELRAAIVASARAKAAESELQIREAERLKREEVWRQKVRAEAIIANDLKKSGPTSTMRVDGGDGKGMTVVLDNKKLLNASNERMQNLIDEQINNKKADQISDKIYIDAINSNNKRAQLYTDGLGGTENSGGGNYSVPGSGDKKAGKTKTTKPTSTAAADRRYQKELDDMLKRGDEAAALARQIQLDVEDARIEAMNEGYDKQIDTLNLQEMRKMEEIDKKKITDNEFKILDKKIELAKDNDKLLFQALKNSWLANNASLEELKLSEQEVFTNKRKTLQYKSEKEFLADQEELHKTALGHLQKEADEEIATYSTLADLKAGLKGRIDNKELQRITTWAQGKESLNKIYQKRELDLQVAHMEAMVKLYEGLDLGLLTPEQRKEVMKFLDEAANKIAELNAKKAGANQDDKADKKPTLGRKSPTDVLGLSTDDWAQMFDNLQTGADKLGTVMAAVSALQNAFGAYYQFVEANEKRQMQQIEQNTNRKKRGLKKQLDEGYINQETYKKLTIKADEDLDKKKTEIALKQAKREKQMAIISTIMNTAQAIMGIWAQFPKFDFGATAAVMSGVVGALGAIQIGTIMSQPLPTAQGYEDGFGMEYPITRQQDGKRFNVRKSRLKSGLVDRPTHFIAGENNKVEMVVDNPTWTSYPPQLKNAIYAANARANGFESGFNMKKESAQASGGNDEIMIKMMSLMSKNIEVLEYIRDTPPIAIIQKNARNGKEVDEMREEYLNLKNKNKH